MTHLEVVLICFVIVTIILSVLSYFSGKMEDSYKNLKNHLKLDEFEGEE